MIRQTVPAALLVVLLFAVSVQTFSLSKRSREIFQLLRDTKEKVKLGTKCLPPSRYFAGSCYTYTSFVKTSSWEQARNNCRSLPLTTDARLLVIESLDEYEFVERELIGPKSGVDSVSVYVGLHKKNDTWLWTNDVPLRETPLLRYWVDNNKDILAYECGVLWLDRNTSVLMAAPCAEQATRPYICKHTIDRCVNNSGGCGKYGTCINLPLLNTHKCQCRFLYSGHRCEKWSSQGLQTIVGGCIILLAFIASYVISMDRSDDSWSFRKSTYDYASVYGQQRPASYILPSSATADRVILNPILPAHPDFVDTSTPNEKRRWRDSSSSSSPPLPPLPRALDRKQRYAFRRSVQELQVTSFVRNLFIKPTKLIKIVLPVTLTTIICILIVHTQRYVKANLLPSSFPNSTVVFKFCSLYENNYYVNLVTLPVAGTIILLMIINQTRAAFCRARRRGSKRFDISGPIPFNPYSKVNRVDTMAVCGIISHETLQIIEDIFLKSSHMKVLTERGPLFDLIRQIGLVIIIGMRYYPVYAVFEMPNANIIYCALCAFYMWFDLILRVLEQSMCVNIGPLMKTWQRFQQFKDDFTAKMSTHSSPMTTTTTDEPDFEEPRSGGLRDKVRRVKNHFTFRRRTTTTTIASPFAMFDLPSTPSHPAVHSMNWSSIYYNFTLPIGRNDSQSTFDQFGIDSGTIGTLKYVPYYLCLTYVCCRLTYKLVIHVYRLLVCCQAQSKSQKHGLKHIYHEPDVSLSSNLSEPISIEYRYVRHLFQKTRRILMKENKKISFFKALLCKIYRPNKYFSYSKQILNMYIIAFMITYYLTFNILQGGFYIIEKIYSILVIPIWIAFDELDLPQPKPFNLKYEIIVACFLTATIYYGQLLWGMKNYQKHMLDAYKGIFIDIPPRSAFQTTRLISKNIHYPGYCIAYLSFGYITMGNTIFFAVVILRVIFKHLFIVEQLAKILIPVLVIYLSKYLIMWFLSRTLFLQQHGRTMALKNLRLYFVFAYFNFFFDCFLGMVSCALRVSKASMAALIFLPRLDYCIFGRALEKLDTGFVAYATFIHMECLHTHPVLVFFCSLVNEQIDSRRQIERTSKRETRRFELEAYSRHRRARFRWWLAITLGRNPQLNLSRKHTISHWTLPAAESFNEFLGRKVFSRFQNHTSTSTKLSLIKSQGNLQTVNGSSTAIIKNQHTACTTLLLDNDDQDEKQPSFQTL